MKTIRMGNQLETPAIALGCMRMRDVSVGEAAKVIDNAMAAGINFFDHADVYVRDDVYAESVFADAVRELGLKREDMILQSKCGIRKDRQTFDFSKEYLVEAVDAILARLRTDYLDVLLLHRPDALVEPEEVGEAFERLRQQGKVRYFGVSNQSPRLMELLQTGLAQNIIANQIQFSLAHAHLISEQLEYNMLTDGAVSRTEGTIEYCRLHNITIQAWSPLQHGFFGGVLLDREKFPELNKALDRIAGECGVSSAAVAYAWLLRHPANLQVILGTMNPERVRDAATAADITLTREQWYQLYLAAGNLLP